VLQLSLAFVPYSQYPAKSPEQESPELGMPAVHAGAVETDVVAGLAGLIGVADGVESDCFELSTVPPHAATSAIATTARRCE
jgi:hypothetical protein